MMTYTIFTNIQKNKETIEDLFQSSRDLLQIDCQENIKQELEIIAKNIRSLSYDMEFYNDKFFSRMCSLCDYMIRGC